jgi:histidinol phosphatase-like enzyme
MKHEELDSTRLIIFGDFGVLTNTPFQDGQPLHMLPGRVKYLAYLQQDRAERGIEPLQYAVTGNKGGVAFGIQTQDEARQEVAWTAEQIGTGLFRVCFAHPKPAAGYERYRDPVELRRRKPEPGMLEEIIEEAAVAKDKESVLVVGTYADDCTAGIALGVRWNVTGKFFAPALARRFQ